MNPRIEILPAKKLVGKRLKMLFSNNRTRELWQQFVPRKAEIKNIVGTDLFSVEVYDAELFAEFNPAKEFEKWAAVEVSNFDSVPPEMEKLVIPRGLYAVFPYRGKSSEAASFYQRIFAEWLPLSEYLLDS